jgi:hypothetical protein
MRRLQTCSARKDGARAAFTEPLQELVRTDAVAGAFAEERQGGGIGPATGISRAGVARLAGGGLLWETAGLGVPAEQGFHLAAQNLVRSTGFAQQRLALAGTLPFQAARTSSLTRRNVAFTAEPLRRVPTGISAFCLSVVSPG